MFHLFVSIVSAVSVSFWGGRGFFGGRGQFVLFSYKYFFTLLFSYTYFLYTHISFTTDIYLLSHQKKKNTFSPKVNNSDTLRRLVFYPHILPCAVAERLTLKPGFWILNHGHGVTVSDQDPCPPPSPHGPVDVGGEGCCLMSVSVVGV